ncbi:MAG: transcription termination/antitermination protein NusG, partial [Planctomycetes bacterium]|nr:transcription termination/antitermination protein NusG [Planctomycetota bacterium]
AAVEPTVALAMQWYVLRVQSGREDSIANNLRKKLTLTQKGHLVRDIVVPKQNLTEIKEGKKRVKKQKLYPGYIFLEAMLEDELWFLIRDTSGIGDFVGTGAKPLPMPAAEVSKLRNIMEEKEEAPAVKIDLIKNDAVKIKEGPFENFDGTVEEVNPAKGIVRVMVTIFGRSTPVDLEYWQVEKL